MALRSLADVGVILTVYGISGNLVLAVLLASITSAIVLVICDVPVAVRHSEVIFARSFRWRELLRLTVYGAPAGITATMTSLNSNIPRYFVERYQGRTMLGYYVSLAQLLQVGVLVNAALSQAALPSLAGGYRQGVRGFRRTLIALCVAQAGIQLIPFGLMATIGTHILTVLYTPDHAQYVGVTVILFAGAALRAVTSGLAAGQTVLAILPQEAVATGVSLATTLVLGSVLVPRLSLLGAAMTVVGAGVVNVVLSALTVQASLTKERAESVS
jgi:O-antigen/teichoic acid export membrane protein